MNNRRAFNYEVVFLFRKITQWKDSMKINAWIEKFLFLNFKLQGSKIGANYLFKSKMIFEFPFSRLRTDKVKIIRKLYMSKNKRTYINLIVKSIF